MCASSVMTREGRSDLPTEFISVAIVKRCHRIIIIHFNHNDSDFIS